MRTVLAEGGHVMGVLQGLNGQTPGRHWVIEPSKSGEYVQPEHEVGNRGLWWEDWNRWLRDLDGTFVKPLSWKAVQRKSIEPAPGSYVQSQP